MFKAYQEIEPLRISNKCLKMTSLCYQTLNGHEVPHDVFDAEFVSISRIAHSQHICDMVGCKSKSLSKFLFDKERS